MKTARSPFQAGRGWASGSITTSSPDITNFQKRKRWAHGSKTPRNPAPLPIIRSGSVGKAASKPRTSTSARLARAKRTCANPRPGSGPVRLPGPAVTRSGQGSDTLANRQLRPVVRRIWLEFRHCPEFRWPARPRLSRWAGRLEKRLARVPARLGERTDRRARASLHSGLFIGPTATGSLHAYGCDAALYAATTRSAPRDQRQARYFLSSPPHQLRPRQFPRGVYSSILVPSTRDRATG